MRFTVFSGLLISLLCLTGCEYDSYVIELTPQTEGFHRQLTAWHVNPNGDEPNGKTASLDKETLAHLREYYPKATVLEDGKTRVFAADFKEQTPGDVGGFGNFLQYDSDLGRLTIYAERFRGEIDLDAGFVARRDAADQIIELLLGWLRAEVGDEPQFAKLETFVDKQLRTDLRNIAIYFWTASTVELYQEGSGNEFVIRMWQYLSQRGYVKTKDIPSLLRAANSIEEKPGPMLAAVQRILAKQLGVEADASCLKILDDPKRLEASLTKYIQQSDSYQEFCRQHQQDNPEDSEKPEPLDYFGSILVGKMLQLDFLGNTGDHVEVKLSTTEEPYQTNGDWNPATGRVTWKHTLRPSRTVPAFSYAAWSQADEEFQTTHFGQVLLSGKPLGEYVLWYNGLEAKEQAAWQAFLNTCKPDDDLPEKFADFRFPAESTDSDPATVAEKPRQLITTALEAN